MTRGMPIPSPAMARGTLAVRQFTQSRGQHKENRIAILARQG